MKLSILCYIALLSPLFARVSEPKWNIVTVVTDDQSTWSVGCYGQTDIKTPYMDSLARDGALFTNAFVNTPVCSPSRATFLTGRHSTELGVTDWLTHGQARKHGISKQFPSWPELLRQNGYTTGLIGKWHLGYQEKSHPKNNGFDYFVGNLAGGWLPKKVEFSNNLSDKKKLMPGDSVNVCTDLAVEFIKENKNKPFSLLIHYREPHAPYGPMPEEDELVTKDLKPSVPDYPNLRDNVGKLTRDYLTAVKAVDRNLGRILMTLKQEGLEKNTIVIFTSDHGYNIGHHGLRHKGNGFWVTKDKNGVRPNMFDTSIGVPLLVRWPQVIKPGTKITELTANIDFFPSVAAMAGIQNTVKHHGYDFTPLLKGEELDQWRSGIFGQYHMVNYSKRSMRMIRTKDWKLVRHFRGEGKDELYHLKNDPGETKNLYGKQEYLTEQVKLMKVLEGKMKQVGDDAYLQDASQAN